MGTDSKISTSGALHVLKRIDRTIAIRAGCFARLLEKVERARWTLNYAGNGRAGGTDIKSPMVTE